MTPCTEYPGSLHEGPVDGVGLDVWGVPNAFRKYKMCLVVIVCVCLLNDKKLSYSTKQSNTYFPEVVRRQDDPCKSLTPVIRKE